MGNLTRFALIIGAAALFAGCGGSQSPIGAPGSIQHSVRTATATPPHLESSSGRKEPTASFRSLYSFGAGTDGRNPQANLINVHGTLYGTTVNGGKYGYGTVFSITQTGSEKVLYDFGYNLDGAYPYSALADVNGTLYGTTSSGGSANNGTVYSITTSGRESVLFSFDGSAGEDPRAALINVNGTLYGTTYSGGSANYGTVYSITTNGVEKVLHSFASGKYDGASPYAGVIKVKGRYYGTTEGGGPNGAGTVYKLTKYGAVTVLYNFEGHSDGSNPIAGLIDVKHTLYGATQSTVYSVNTAGGEKVLHVFNGGSDGASPWASLIHVNIELYGTTLHGGGGSGSGCSGGCGTIYSIVPIGGERVLHSFSGSDGASPAASLIYVSGVLYGTTSQGGAHGNGTVFALTP